MDGRSELILISVDLNIFTEFLSKTALQLWSQACIKKIEIQMLDDWNRDTLYPLVVNN